MKNILIIVMSLYVAEISGNPKLLFANRKDIRVINFSEGKLSKSILVKDVNDAASVDFYYMKQEVCWTDIGNEFIKCVSLNGSNKNTKLNEVKLISRGITSPDGMAIDWLTEKIYWADSETDKIEVAELYGPNRKVLYWKDLDQPRAIALVPSEGIMFWSDWGEIPKLERAGMNGDHSSRRIIVDKDIMWPNGLTIDYENRRLFWADGKCFSISSVNFDGGERVKVINHLKHPFAITYFDHTLYWTDWRTEAIHYCSVNSQNKCDHEKQLSLKLSPMYIHVYDQLRQPYHETACHHHKGGCSHLCLLAPYPENYTCACPTGVNLVDKFTCDKGPNDMLLLARRSDLRRISLDTTDRTPVVLPVTNVHHAIAVDYDPIEGFFYWTDDEAYLIQRARLNGSDQQVLIYSDGLDSDGVAIEWLARNLYWSDAKNNRIEVAKLDGSSRKILLRRGLDEPRAIALYPEGGLMFWTDWGNKSKIEQSFLDGSNRKTIVNTKLGWPNGVAVDQIELKIYWVDARSQVIEVAEFDGSSRRVVVSGNLPHVFGFSLLGDFIYWTDWQRRSIERVHKHNETFRELLVDQLPDVMGLKALSVNQVMGNSPCKHKNGNCSHLCFNRPRGTYVCDCPLEYELDYDGRTCVVPKEFLLFSQPEIIERISTNTYSSFPLPMPNLIQPTSLDADEEGKLYWCDVSMKAILSSYMNGSQPRVLVNLGLAYPGSLAVDWLGKNIYWSDVTNDRIEVSKVNGSWRKIILWNITSPKSLAIDSGRGFLYWSELTVGNGEKIMKSFLDGSSPTQLLGGLGRVKDLSLDVDDGLLYWLNIDKKTIESCDSSGKNRKVVIGNLKEPVCIALSMDHIYWYDMATKTIERALKPSGLERVTVKVDVEEVLDMYVFWSVRSSIRRNPCLISNGNCSHLCIYSPSEKRSYTCACPTHFVLSDDAKTCFPPSSFLLFSQKSSITRLSVEPSQYPTAVLPIQNLRNVQSIAYDPVSYQIFWIDSRSHVIRTSDQLGMSAEVLVKGKDAKPFDLVVDSNSGLIFWTCASNNVINVTKFDGTEVGSILGVSSSLVKPRSLALHFTMSVLFYVNMLQLPTIESISMNGLRRRVIVKDDLLTPVALTVDSKDGMLFWIDFNPVAIHTADVNGQNRKILLDSGVTNPTSLAVHENQLYWIDPTSKTIERINKFSGQERMKILSKIPHLTDIVSVSKHLMQSAAGHPCLDEGKKCSHICVSSDLAEENEEYSFLMPFENLIAYDNNNNKDASSKQRGVTKRHFHCECPLGLVLSQNEYSCIPKPICPPKQFSCLSGQNCVPTQWRCDGIKECADGSDELNCSPPLICDSSSMFRCISGECIENVYVCDQTVHCSDGSDELECCPSGEAICKSSGHCTPCSQPEKCPEKIGQCPFPITHLSNEDSTTGSSSGSRAPYIVGIFASSVVLICIAAIAYYYRRRPTILDEGATEVQALKETRSSRRQQQHPVLMSGGKIYTGIRGEGLGPRPPHCLFSSHRRVLGGVPPDDVCCSSVVNVVERPQRQVTGASSSSSSLTHYPRETINPPPTPVANSRVLCQETHCCHGGGGGGGAPPTSLNSYRHYKFHNRPPPPTPCSTDVCDDSDFHSSSVVVVSSSSSPPPLNNNNSPHHCISPSSTTCYYSSPPLTATDYDSDPYPPPPTPITPSYPPSPSTDRSYFIHAPCPSPLSNSLSD